MASIGQRLHVLLLTVDPSLIAKFADASRELGIEAQSTRTPQHASDQLNRARYEGVIVDFDTVTDARPP